MTTPTITVYMDRTCTECGKPGATGSGRCLECGVDAAVKGLKAMDNEQLSLTSRWTDLTDAEKIDRGFQLANLIREAALMKAEHDSRKHDMKEDRDTLEEKIAVLAATVRTGREERPIAR